MWPSSAPRTQAHVTVHARTHAHTESSRIQVSLICYNGTHICLHKSLALIRCFHTSSHFIPRKRQAAVSTLILLIWKQRPTEVRDSAKSYTAESESWNPNWILLWDVLESHLVEVQFPFLENEGI